MFDIITDREELKIDSIKDKIERYEFYEDEIVAVLTIDGFSYTFDAKKFNKIIGKENERK